MTNTTSLRLAFLFAIGLGVPATAQTPTEHAWSDGTTVNAFGGLAVASSDTGALAGGGAGWEMTRTVGLEGRMAWANGVGEGDTFAASLTFSANLRQPRPVVPFVKAGIGLYRASFAPAAALPAFYQRQVTTSDSPMPARIFTDPSLVFGAGVNVFTSRHVAFRPELGLTCVLSGGHVMTVPSVTLHLAYHFEAHPVTATRRR